MLPLPHGTHLHPSRVSACSAGTWSSADRLPHGGRHRRQGGRAAVLPVLPVLRAGASCRYRLRLGPQPTHMITGSTRARPLRLRVRACRCYAYRTKNPPLYKSPSCSATTGGYYYVFILLSLPMIVDQLVVRGSRCAPTPPHDGPTGSPESARPRVSFLSLLFRGAAPLAALITSFRSCFWCSNGAMCSNH